MPSSSAHLAVPATGSPGDVLVATTDPALAEAAGRWCAAVGASSVTVQDAGQARRAWRTGEAVLLGVDLAASLVPLIRRDRVLIMTAGPEVPADLAVGVGADGIVSALDDQSAVATLSDALDGGRDGCVVVVVGAVGGAGSSTTAAVLAAEAARRGFAPVVVDDDPCGGGIDLLLGAEDVAGARWEDLDSGGGPWGARALRQALPGHEGVAFLTWGRADTVSARTPRGDDLAAVVLAARRGFDLVVVDLPRHRLTERAEVLGAAEACVVLMPDDVRSLAAARRLLPILEDLTTVLLAVSVDRPVGAGPAVVADVVGRPVLGRVPSSRRVRSGVDAGRGLGSWPAGRRATASVLDLLGLDVRAAS